MFFVNPIKIIEVIKATPFGDFQCSYILCPNQMLCQIQTVLIDIAHNRLPRYFFEKPAKMAFAESAQICQYINTDFCM